MNAGMWKAYTNMYAASRVRWPPLRGSQEWPIATSTIARYLALSKKASRCFAGGLSGWGARGLGTPCPDDCVGSGARDGGAEDGPVALAEDEAAWNI
ncbi:hypothetical protein GCM10022206_52230 [Streptomyces chiangmaiensis]